ncbi:restnol dehydrogenase, putative [Entamoeba invadens IP1]|uniref:Restnol dehydrogenase, putative n=1 Tax=Entamoeba invadens IP1 TaxID=370355 RepID=A0A0A1TU47_ENTIV|nr:restnol dehydrogenase, putative [Entamoeba invadens IP1]ELP83430.1 restnol dehydrogenase, putative [Entamoeba invadens IP1]|eukprot:XP_004182776.1 restnol dehydrogenase, putative [Entamoeba invadens IP1]
MSLLAGVLICLVLYILIVVIYAKGVGMNWHYPDLHGKTVCILGGTAGIGLETAKKIKSLGANLIIVGRNPSTLEDVTNVEVDLSDLKSVKTGVEKLEHIVDHIDILINNAGCVVLEYGQKTKQGYDITVGVNYIGTASFAIGVSSLLMNAKAPRFVVVSSLNAGDWHEKELPFDWEKAPGEEDPYIVSKTACSLFAVGYAKKYPKIQTAHVHPGFVKSSLWRNMTGFTKALYAVVLFLVGRNCWEGAQTSLYCALAPKIVSGEYYADCLRQEINVLCHDEEVIEKLWKKTMEAMEKVD